MPIYENRGSMSMSSSPYLKEICIVFIICNMYVFTSPHSLAHQGAAVARNVFRQNSDPHILLVYYTLYVNECVGERKATLKRFGYNQYLSGPFTSHTVIQLT